MRKLSRRRFVKFAATAVALSPSLLQLGRPVMAAEMPKVDPDDPQARGLSYVHESPKPESLCANCMLYTGSAESEWGPCAVFPGKLVAADGWCSAWVKKGG
jgi:hypothetical protein